MVLYTLKKEKKIDYGDNKKEDHAATSTIGHSRMTLLSALYIKEVFKESLILHLIIMQRRFKEYYKIRMLHYHLDSRSNELDWEYMEKYISAIEKKYVVKLKEEMDKKMEVLNKMIQ